MKFLPSQLAYLTTDREARANLRALGKYLLFLVAMATLYAVLFHVITPWWLTPLASNWQWMDDTLAITVIITDNKLLTVRPAAARDVVARAAQGIRVERTG